MLYPEYFFMCASTFYDVLNALAVRDTNVEQSKLNRMLSGETALALHGIDTGSKPKYFEVTVYEPNEKQIDYLVKDVPNLVCGLTGTADLPIVKMRELNVFHLTKLDVTLRITLERNTPVPETGLLFRYGGTFYRVQGCNAVSVTTPYCAGDSFLVTVGSVYTGPEVRIGQEFLDEPWPPVALGYDVNADLIKIRKKIPKIQDFSALKALSDTYKTLRSCNTISDDINSEMNLLFMQRELGIQDEIATQDEVNPED